MVSGPRLSLAPGFLIHNMGSFAGRLRHQGHLRVLKLFPGGGHVGYPHGFPVLVQGDDYLGLAAVVGGLQTYRPSSDSASVMSVSAPSTVRMVRPSRSSTDTSG